MKSASELAIIVGAAILAGIGTWVVDGRPAASPVERVEQVPLRDGEIRLEDAPMPGEPGVVWIDARPEEKWRQNGLSGAISITTLSSEPLEAQIARHMDELAVAERVIVYCDDVDCGSSRELVGRIEALGLFEAEFLVLHGGAAALLKAGRIKEPTPSR